MARTNTLNPSCKLCRRENEKLFLKGDRCYTSKCAIVKRNYVPGFHGVQRQPRLSEYGQQLRAKQKAKRMYGVMERQFVTYYRKASSQEDSAIALKRMLEMRFDNVVYRLGFADSRAQARQIVQHGHITVNGRKTDIPSYQTKEGDTISWRESSMKTEYYKQLLEDIGSKNLVSWLSLDRQRLFGQIISLPTLDEVGAEFDGQAVVEYYSR